MRKENQLMSRPPSNRHALVGSLLRQYRENLGYNLDDAARILDCDRSKISRIETGQRGIRSMDLRLLLTEYGLDSSIQATLVAITGRRGAGSWWNGYRQVLGEGYVDFVMAEAAASGAWVYAPLSIPDLLQTEAYAEAVMAVDVTIPEDNKVLAVEALVTRQAAFLYERRTDLNVVIGEAALKQQTGEAGVLREQLAHLAELTEDHPWITIRILPFTSGTHASGSGGFSVLRFSAIPTLGLVHVPGPGGGICLDDAAAIGTYTGVFTQVSCFALNAEQSAEKLHRIAQGQPWSTEADDGHRRHDR
jgi:DNA-binding XRE family transcriptional regulator